MAPPIIKQIELLSNMKTNVHHFLNEQDFNERPTVISLMKFPDEQEPLLEMIEEYFENKFFIYPVYILSSMPEFPTQLNVIDNLNQVPKFYKQKSKQLNIKENLIYNKIKLKQEQLKSINQSETTPTIKNYAFEHKIISEKESFNKYLKDIIHKIRNRDGI